MSTIIRNGKVRILEFRDEFQFLSHDYPSPLKVFSHEFRTARDAISFFASIDCTQRDKLKNGTFSYDEPLLIRNDWVGLENAVKEAVLSAKFSQSPKLAGRLLGTGALHLTDDAYPVEGLMLTRMRDRAFKALEQRGTGDIGVALEAIGTSGLEPFKGKYFKGTTHHLKVEYAASGEVLTNPVLMESLGAQVVGSKVFFLGPLYPMSKKISDRKDFASKIRGALDRLLELTERKIAAKGLSPFLRLTVKSIFSECGERYREQEFRERLRPDEEVEGVER